MSSIPDQSLMAGPSFRQNALYDAQFSSYVRKQSFSAHESLDAGLTIKTKEGDLVTLTTHTYSELDAFMYNSKGVLQAESEKANIIQNQREIILTSGESFSFSVVGDLSEEELGDIESIVKEMDEIISEMAQGDMDAAVSTALAMGGYDSISMYAADITYQKSYAMTSETRAEAVKNIPEAQILPIEEIAVPSVEEIFSENSGPKRKADNTKRFIDEFVEKMVEKLNSHEEKLVDRAREPIDKLFSHHLGNIKKNKAGEISNPNHTAIDTAGKKIAQMIEQMAGKMFKDRFSAIF